MPAPSTPDAYRPHLQSDFVAQTAPAEGRVFRLVEVKVDIDDEVQHCFALFFTSEGEQMEQGTFTLQHPVLGEIPLFMVPIRQGRSGLRYEAVFNLLRDQGQ